MSHIEGWVKKNQTIQIQIVIVFHTDERALQELGPNEGTKARLRCPERMEDPTSRQFYSRLLTGPEQYERLSEVDLGAMVASCQDSYIVSLSEADTMYQNSQNQWNF